MKKVIIILIIFFTFIIPVHAVELTPPDAPESALPYLPDHTDSFSDGLWYIIKKAIQVLNPSLQACGELCLFIICVVILVSLMNLFTGISNELTEIVGIISISVSLLEPTNTLIHLGIDTIHEISEYGKALFPVMTAAYAAEGSLSGSTALYAGTTLFNTILTSLISAFIIPLILVYLCLSVACNIINDYSLIKIKDLCKTLMSWILKTIMYVFTGYITVTGVISGTADASAIKATKITISGMVPVVGKILSDASETMIVTASLMKNAVGMYGLFVILACCMVPFMKIGIQYLLLKITSEISTVFGSKKIVALIRDFSNALGLLLGASASVCLLLLIGTICYMKGFG